MSLDLNNPGYDIPTYLDLFEEVPELKNGWMELPNRPGLGLEFNEQAVRKYKVD